MRTMGVTTNDLGMKKNKEKIARNSLKFNSVTCKRLIGNLGCSSVVIHSLKFSFGDWAVVIVSRSSSRKFNPRWQFWSSTQPPSTKNWFSRRRAWTWWNTHALISIHRVYIIQSQIVFRVPFFTWGILTSDGFMALTFGGFSGLKHSCQLLASWRHLVLFFSCVTSSEKFTI